MPKYRDSEGDVWVPDDGQWHCVAEGHHTWLPTLESVDYIWGPLSEVEE
jgi:hypothetical protein